MKTKFIVAAALTVVTCGTDVSVEAQPIISLSGQFQCVQDCRGSGPAYVTQNGWELNLVNEIGQPSIAWID